MKKIIVLVILLCINTGYIYSQTVAGGIFSSQNVLTIRVKPSQSFSGTSISNLTFSIRWDTSYHISVSDMTNSFGILKDGGIQTSGAFNYQNYATTTTTPIVWNANQEYALGTITISGGSGTGTLELSPTGFTAGGNGDWYVEIGGTSYTPLPGSEYYQSSTVANLYQPGPAAKLGIQTQPSANATAGIAFSPQPVIAIEDASGNINTTDNSTVVTATRLSGTGTLQGTTTATASNGLATFSNLSYTVAENITIQFTSGSLTSATSNTVTVTPAVAAVVRMETAANGSGTIVPSQNVSSGNSITAYAITRDAFNNFIANVGASFWTIQNPTGGISAGDLIPSADSTRAVFTGHIIGTGQIIANYAGLNRTSSGTISVIAGTPSQVRVETAVDGSGTVVPSQSLPAGNSLTAYAITRDASNNFVANVAASSWSLQSSTGGIVSGDLVPSGDSKSAIFTGHSAGSTQIHATSGALTITNSGTITVISGNAVRVKFAAQPPSTTSGAILSSVTIQLKDALGNNVPSSGVSVALTLQGTGNLFGTVSRTTDATGLATFNNLSIDTVGSKHLIATSSGLTSDTSSAFIISPGAPKKLIFVQQPNSTNTNLIIAPPVTIQVQDSLGNSVTTSGISISVAKAAGNSGNLSGTTTQTTNASGLATFNDLSFNQNGSKQLVASSSGLTSVTSNPFTISNFTITSSENGTGTISPLGVQSLSGGQNITFTITPNTGSHIDSVVVDGLNQGAITTYPFTNVASNHTIAAYFSVTVYTITSSAGLNGTISPNGTTPVNSGSSQSFTMTPSTGYHIDSVFVDGSYVGNTSPYNFTNVVANHTISVKFAINQYTITASAGTHGKITPSGSVVVSYGSNPLFTFTPDTGYQIQNVLVDGISQGTVPSYTFLNVTANHTVSVAFTPDTLSITVQSNPAGLKVIVDGTTVTSPTTVNWIVGTNHTLGVVDTVANGSGSRIVWSSWSNSGAKSQTVSPIVTTTFTANFTTQYFLTMTANSGGTVAPPSGWFNSGQNVQIQAFPSANYNFQTWAGTGNGSTSGSTNPVTIAVNNAITEIANFIRQPIQITIQANPPGLTFIYDGQSYNTPQTRTINPGDQHNLNAVSPQSGGSNIQYAFNNWSDSGAIFHVIAPDSNTTYTVNFKKQYNLTVVAGLNGTVSPASGYLDSGTVTNITATANNGFIFKKWDGSGTGSYSGTNNPATVTMKSAINDTAFFVVDTMIITATAGANGTISPSGSVKVPYGSNQTFTITPTGLYHISDVVVDGSSVGAVSSYQFTNVTAAHTITASFTLNGYTITSTAGANGTIAPSGAVSVNGGANQSFTITPNYGYHNDSLFIDNVSTAVTPTYQFTNINANHTIRVTFAPNTQTVKVQSNISGLSLNIDGTILTSPQTLSWLYNSTHTIAAVDTQAGAANTRYTWLNWNDAGTKSHSVTIAGDTTFTASFTTQYFLTMATDGNGTSTPASSWQNSGAVVTITGTGNTGFTFGSWTGTGSGSRSDGVNPASITMNAPITETAHFTRFNAQVTVQTNPAGEQITIDGVTYASPHTIALTTGTIHTIAVPDTQSGTTGTRYLYNSWNDGGSKSHSVTILSDTTFTASFTTQYYLTMVANQGGTVTPPSNWFNRGQVIPIIATPNANYTFTSWSGLGYSGSLDSATVTMNQPITETASFQHNPIQITVTTYPPGLAYTFNGTPYTTPQSVSFLPGTLVYLGANSPQNGSAGIQYVWKNWNTGSAQYSTYTIPDTNKSISIIANFGTQYLLTTAVTSVGTGGTVSPPSSYLDSGTVATLTATPNTGSIFKKWSGSGSGSYSGTNNPASVTMKSVINDTAFFVVDTMIITATAGANGTISPSGSVKVPYGSNQTFTITPTGLYHISDVVVDGSSVGAVSSYQFTNVTAAHTITASFTLNGYTITATAGANGTIAPSGAVSVNGGANQSFTITPNYGYHNDSLFIDNVSTAVTPTYQFTNINANHTIRVTFAPNTQTVKIQSNISGLLLAADGTTYASPHTFSWLFNSTHTIAAVDTQAGAANTRYTWLSWNDGGTKLHSVTVNGDSTFTASFTTQFFLTMNADSGSVTPPSSWRNSGAVVPITAIPNPGFKFVSWNGTGSGSTSDTLNPSSVTVNGPITETAHFTRFSAQVKVQTNPAGQQIIVDGTTYASPQVFNWTTGSFHTIAVPDTQTGGVGTRYTFSSWNDNGAISHSVSAASDSTFMANFSTQYYLTMAANVGGSASPPSGWFNRNQVVTIIAIPDVNHLFSSWSGPGYSGSLDTAIVTMTQPMTETASFQHKPIQLTISTYPPGLAFTFNGTPYTTPQTVSFIPGTLIYLGANSPQNIPGQSNIQYVWKNWNTGSAQYSTYSIPDTNSSIAIIANFGIQYLLTTSAGPGGSVTPPTGQWEDSGSVVTLTATPNLGYSFLQWTGKGTGSYTGFINPATITMNAPLSDSASFSRFTVHITVKSNPPGRPITVDGTAYDTTQIFNWISGTTHTLVASTQVGDTSTRYVYNNWGDGGAQSQAVTVFGDSTFVANYTTQYYLKMIAGSGGTVSPPSNWFNAGSGVLISATPNATYNFGGWNGTGSGSYSGTQIDTSVTLTGPITESASFVLVPVHVTVKTNPTGRTFTVDSVKYSSTQSFIWQYGSTHIIGTSTPQNFSASTQYSWKTWNDGGTITHSVIPVRDTIFTANFIPQYYLTTLSDTGGTVSPGIGWQDSGKVVTITATPNSGFQFADWKGSGAGSYSGTSNPALITMNGPISDTANFSRFTAQTTIQTIPSGLSIVVDGVQYTSPHSFSWTTGSSHSISSIDTTAGNNGTRYAWSSWNDGGSRTHTVVSVHDSIFTANYITQFYLTMIANVGGTITPSNWWYNSGQVVIITATPDSIYNFNSWNGGGIGSYSGVSDPATITMNSPITETANFTRKPVQITIQTNPPGRPFIFNGVTYTNVYTTTVSPGTQLYLSASSPQLIDAGIQYVWKSWSDGGLQTHTIIPDSSTTYTAFFSKQFYLTTTAGPNGTVLPASNWEDSGSTVIISATGNTNYAFSQWFGSGSGSYTGNANPSSVKMNEPISDSASFAPAFRVTIASIPSGQSVIIDDSTYTTPAIVYWIKDTLHSIGTTAIQNGTTGVKNTWKQWSDSGAIVHNVSVKDTATFTTTFLTQYYFTISGNGHGIVVPSNGWFPKDTSFQIRALPDSGYAFVEWIGTGLDAYSGQNAFANVLMHGPVSETATFGLILPPPTLHGVTNDSVNVATQPVLSWNPYPGATSYRIQVSADSSRNPDGTFKNPAFDSALITTTQARTSPLANSTFYYWHVDVRAGNNISTFSPAWTFTTLGATITAATPLVNWATGYVFPITWSSSSLSGPVTIKLSHNGGNSYQIIQQNHPNTGNTVWRIPDSTVYISQNCLIRVESSLNSNIFDISSSFAILSGHLPTAVPLTTLIPFPGAPSVSTEYRLFSGPGLVDTIRISSFLFGNQKTDWRIYSDDGSVDNYLTELSPTSFLQTGAGYWLIKKGNLNIPTYRMVMPPLDSTASFGIPLHSGWNIIGDPFDESIPWQAVLDANNLPPATAVLGYAGSYAQSFSLAPFQGYYYFNTSNAELLKMPYPFGSSRIAPATVPQVSWKLRLSTESDINTDAENYIGIAPTATTGANQFNQHKPPLFQDQSFLYFSRPEWDKVYSRYSSDIRPSLDDGQVWPFEVINPRKSKSTIRINGIENVPAGMEIMLIDRSNSSPVDLRKNANYVYQTISPKMQFEIIVGTKEYVTQQIKSLVPKTFELEQNFPNPFNLSTAIGVQLPHSSRIRLDIYSVLGQLVKTLADGEFSQGVHTFWWNGEDASGKIAASGVYFYRLIEGTQVLQTKKMVLTK